MANVAVLLEPFPIRNSSSAFGWIAEKLCQMLLAGQTGGYTVADLRVICNEPLMAHISKKLPAARPYLLQASTELQAPFRDAMVDWHTSGLDVWKAIQRGSPAHEPLYEALVASLQESYPFDVLAYWGTNETLRAVADRLGIPMLWAEYGPLRSPFPTHFCLDASGVNGFATGRDTLRIKGAEEPIVVPGPAFDLQVGAVSAYEATMMLPPPATGDSFAKLMRFTRDRRRIVLLVMQLADDANILAFGNGWTCQILTETMLKLRAGPDTVFIIRPHPAESAAYHTLQAGEAIRDLVADRPDVLVFDDEGQDAYLACLSVASEVVCINSSVGFEASMLGKPVRVVGQASYMPPDGGADLTAPPVQLDNESIQTLLRERFIPEQRFWSLDCWRERAAAAAQPSIERRRKKSKQHQAAHTAALRLVPRLPTANARGFGAAGLAGDGTLVVEGLGTFALLPSAMPGYADEVKDLSKGTERKVGVRGWGVDPQTDGMLAGFVVSAGNRSVWFAGSSHRSDVARHYKEAAKLACGFELNIAQKDLPNGWTHPIRVFGITATGYGTCLNNEWVFDKTTGKFSVLERAVAA